MDTPKKTMKKFGRGMKVRTTHGDPAVFERYEEGSNSVLALIRSEPDGPLETHYADSLLFDLESHSYEEGQPCPQGCEVALEFKPVEDCSCHVAPPCNACVTAPLYCSECGWEEDA